MSLWMPVHQTDEGAVFFVILVCFCSNSSFEHQIEPLQ